MNFNSFDLNPTSGSCNNGAYSNVRLGTLNELFNKFGSIPFKIKWVSNMNGYTDIRSITFKYQSTTNGFHE